MITNSEQPENNKAFTELLFALQSFSSRSRLSVRKPEGEKTEKKNERKQTSRRTSSLLCEAFVTQGFSSILYFAEPFVVGNSSVLNLEFVLFYAEAKGEKKLPA